MATPENRSYEIPSEVLYREVDGQMVLLNLDTEQYFGLNQVGAQIVTRVSEAPLGEALAALRNDFEVDPAVLQRDVEALLVQLVDAGLLRQVERAR